MPSKQARLFENICQTPDNKMKKTLALLTAVIGVGIAVQAQLPVPTYQWNFNQTNINSTNYIFPTISNGTVPESPASLQGVLKSVDGSGNSANVLGVPGSGVSGGAFPNITFDRSVVIPGTYGANSYMVRTVDDAHAITNFGVITNFTITCWAKVETNPPAGSFPRIVMFGANGQDAGSAGLNAFGILQYNNYDIQLKIHNVSNPNSGNGMSTSTQPLAAGATNWVFIAVTYDGTLPSGGTPTSGTNTVFYVGNRVDSFLSPTLAPSVSIIYSNYYLAIAGALGSVDSPGYINFDPTVLNGNGTSFGITNVYVSIGNRYNGTGANASGGNRAFNGRYDDVRLFANKVLTLAQVEAVRTNAPPFQGGPLVVQQQPADTTVAEGQGASFTVVTSEAANRTYQWFRIPKGVGSVSNLVVGATSTTYTTTNLTVAGNDGDKYAVQVHSTDPSSDNGGKGVFSVYATAHVLSTSQYVVTPGMLKFEFYNAGTGTTVANFLNNPTANYTNNTPDQTLFLSSFDTRTIFPDNSQLNYFGQVSGWITPTVTTNYVFFIRASDQADLQLSTDNTTNNLVPIAADTVNAGQLFEGSELNGVVAGGGTFSPPIALVAGTSYAVLAHVKSSSGQNFLQVAWRMDSGAGDLPANDQNLSDRLQPIPGSYLSALALPLGSVAIAQQPVASPSSTVTANSKITFTVGVNAVTNSGSGPLVIQWRKNGNNIPGATGASYTTPYLGTSDSGAQFGAVVSLPGVSNLATAVTVTVNADITPPKVLGAVADDSAYATTVQFSEPVDPVTALDKTKYSISGGVSVVSVSYVVNTNLASNPAYDAVKLTTSRQADNTAYTVTVTGVKDTAGNTITSGNKASYLSDGFASGFGKFEYFENQGYSSSFAPSDDNTVNGLVAYLPKFINNDPDTIVYPHSLEMSPQGQATFRSGAVGRNGLPPGFYGTRMSAIITPTNTANYVFYLATDDTGVLWLSTDDNPTNKHAIAFCTYDANNTGQTRRWSSANSTMDTGALSTQVTVPGATFWPVVDGGNVPIITLTKGQRYYLEVDQRETAGFSSVSTVNWDNGTGVAPVDGSATLLTSNLIGWRFPQPQISSIAKNGSTVSIAWTNSLSSISQGVFPWPGVTAPASSITPSFPSPFLQSTPALNPVIWTSLTNTSPAVIPASAPVQFFRVGDQ
jgi:hypothetical protein